jgi:hypothetical protein
MNPRLHLAAVAILIWLFAWIMAGRLQTWRRSS